MRGIQKSRGRPALEVPARAPARPRSVWCLMGPEDCRCGQRHRSVGTVEAGALGNLLHGLGLFVFGRRSAQPGAIANSEASSSSPNNQTGHAGSMNTAAIHVWSRPR
jgi:hypothetical protein